MAESIVSHREWQATKPFASDQVSVHNLRVDANAGFDIWGRQKTQPVEISVVLSLSHSFSSAAAGDVVDASTIHYGHLSKAVLEVARDRIGAPWRSPHELIHAVAVAAKQIAADPSIIATIEATVIFPKASRLGEGVGLLLCHRPVDELTTTVLHLNRIKMPALVGVNPHERTMKQPVVISIAVDRINPRISEAYCELEQLVDKTAEESSFETLESLAEELAARVIKYFILPKQQFPLPEPAGVRVRIEKPSAVPQADAPSIEIYRSAGSQDPFGKRMIFELGNKKPHIPFPLQGRLDEFLQSWKQD